MTRKLARFARLILPGLAFASVAVALVPPGFAADRDRDDHWRWRDRGWHDYREQPNVYYSAPPVVYAPYGAYAQPGISLNLSIPIR